jgi:hypothetical protein
VQRNAGSKAITIIYKNYTRILFTSSNAIRKSLSSAMNYTQEYSTVPSLTLKHSSLGSVMSCFHLYRKFYTSLTLALLLGSLSVITLFICLTAILETGFTFISLPITRNIWNLEKVFAQQESNLSNSSEVKWQEMAVLPDYVTKYQFQSLALNHGNTLKIPQLLLLYQQH